MASNSPEDAAEVEKNLFSWVENAIFCSMMGASVLIGVYFAVTEKQRTVVDYMLGGKKMATAPVSLSLITSFMSGITILGWPSEIHYHGTQAFIVVLVILIITLKSVFFYIPVFYHLQIATGFEYLERRFSSTVREIASGLYILLMFVYIPIVIYVPALAFSHASRMPLYLVTLVLTGVCLFYTILGGLKAVVWADTFQSTFMFGSIIALAAIGINRIGLQEIYEINKNGTRLELFNMDPDPFERNTFWTILIGLTLQWSAIICVSPISVQRYISLPKFENARKAVIILGVGVLFIEIMCTTIGLILYATYHDCDPLLIKEIKKPGQILIHYLAEVAKDYPGLNGLFMAGIVSAALSTMSTTMNTAAGLVYEDFIKKIVRREIEDSRASILIKCISLLIGLATTALTLVIEKLGMVLQLGYALTGLSTGPMLFLFIYGMFFPWGTSKGAILGSLASVATVSPLIFGAQYYTLVGKASSPGKVLSVAGCPKNLTDSLGLNFTEVGHRGVGSPPWFHESVPRIFQVSYLHYHTIGIAVGFLVAFVTQYFSGSQDLSKVDPMVIVPQMRRFLPRRSFKEELPERSILLEKS